MLYSEGGISAIRWRLIPMELKNHPTPWRKAGYVDDRRSDNSKEEYIIVTFPESQLKYDRTRPGPPCSHTELMLASSETLFSRTRYKI